MSSRGCLAEPIPFVFPLQLPPSPKSVPTELVLWKYQLCWVGDTTAGIFYLHFFLPGSFLRPRSSWIYLFIFFKSISRDPSFHVILRFSYCARSYSGCRDDPVTNILYCVSSFLEQKCFFRIIYSFPLFSLRDRDNDYCKPCLL